MKKIAFAGVSIFALALATAASADSFGVAVDSLSAFAPVVAVTGGVGTTIQPSGGSGAVSTGKTSWSPVRIEANGNASAALFSWVNDALQQKSGASHSLVSSTYDASGNAKQQTKYTSPQFVGLVLPPLSKADKSAATFLAEFAIQGTSVSTVSGKAPEARVASSWTHASFDASLAGMPAPIGVSALQFSIPFAPGSGLATGKPRLSSIHLIFDGSQLKALQSWLAQGKVTPMMSNGASGGGFAAKDARIVYHAMVRDRQSDMFTVTLKTCGPMAVAQSGANADVEIMCGDYAFAAVAP